MDYTDFLTRLFKKTGGKYFHLILDTIASKVKMSDGTTVEDTLNSTRNQANTAYYAANAAQNTADSAYNKAQVAQETAELKLALLEKLAMQNFAPNDEIWITESGDFEVPYDGVYEVTCIGGGGGSICVDSANVSVIAGYCGSRITKTILLHRGDIVPVSIGAGGFGGIYPNNSESSHGGITTFGDISTNDPLAEHYPNNSGNTFVKTSDALANLRSASLGPNGANALFVNANNDSTINSATRFGGGGAAVYGYNTNFGYGNGYQGAARLRFFNPEKASLPTFNDTDLIPYVNLLQRLEAIEAQLNINS